MLHARRTACGRRVLLALIMLAAPYPAAPARAQGVPPATELAAGMGLTPAQLEEAAGLSLDELDSRLERFGSGTRSDYSGGNVLSLTSVGACDQRAHLHWIRSARRA